jgi:hypothetical protein
MQEFVSQVVQTFHALVISWAWYEVLAADELDHAKIGRFDAAVKLFKWSQISIAKKHDLVRLLRCLDIARFTRPVEFLLRSQFSLTLFASKHSYVPRSLEGQNHEPLDRVVQRDDCPFPHVSIG